ncbi:hypothetical protein ACFQZ1_05930 [Bacillus sp. CGMCC 1.60114]|uniref:hypothetical protein n=1 Tax=unclassified Bacillus (in: firmicutes) TaxID=185979 RepID=UPI003633001F
MRRNLKSVVLMCFALIAVFFSAAPSTFAEEGKSQFVLINGKKASSPVQDSQVKHIFFSKDQNGKEIKYGFTNEKEFQQFVQNKEYEKHREYKNPKAELIKKENLTTLGTGPNYTDFYWDINKGGSRISYAIGTYTSYVGNYWNDQISSISTAASGYTRVWEHASYGGATYAWDNYSYWGYTINLNNYGWNDAISSLGVFNY